MGTHQILTKYLHKMKGFEQKKYLNAIITVVAKQYFGSSLQSKEDAPIKTSPITSSVAGLIHGLVGDSELLKEHLLSSLTKSTIQALDDSLDARRSVLAAIAQDEGQCHMLRNFVG